MWALIIFIIGPTQRFYSATSGSLGVMGGRHVEFADLASRGWCCGEARKTAQRFIIVGWQMASSYIEMKKGHLTIGVDF